MLHIEQKEHAPSWLLRAASNEHATHYGFIRIYQEELANRSAVLRDRTSMMVTAMQGMVRDLSANVKQADFKGSELKGLGFDIVGAALSHDYRVFSV